MPHTEYRRIDLPVVVSAAANGRVRVQLGISASAPALEGSVIGIEQQLGSALLSAGNADFTDSHPPTYHEVIGRITLDIRDPSLAGIDWEALFLPAARQLKFTHPGPNIGDVVTWAVVRVSRVRPRFLTLPLALPVRILQLNADPKHDVRGWVVSVFDSHSREAVDRAIQVHATDSWTAPESWPTVDVLHVDYLPTLAFPEAAMTTAQPNLPGSLGWFTRCTERWQTRLVILHCHDEAAATARRFAHAFVHKGGPAVLVAVDDSSAEAFYAGFYERLVHDFPLDDIILNSNGSVRSTLFCGAGREDGVRFSNVGAKINDLLQHSMWRDLGHLDTFALGWQNWRFNLHEAEGLLPMAAEIATVRDQLKPLIQTHPIPTGPRFVNSSIWSDSLTSFEQVPQADAVLDVGGRYQLAIHIGAQDAAIRVLNAEAIFEEVFKWSPSLVGVWVEIAVAGIDFDVTGDPVQELWLPREGASEPVYFAISPRVDRVANLRFGLYYKNNLIQSFLMAALTRVPGSPAGGTADLASALSIAPTRLANEGYLTRMEYSRTSDFDAIPRKPQRALTITANKLGDREIFLCKGNDVYTENVRAGNEVGRIATKIRRTLDKISYIRSPQPSQAAQYQFAPDATELEDRCKAGIRELAIDGFRLFTKLALSPEERESIRKILGGPRKTIHVASILREKIVPWAFVYDAPFDDETTNINGADVEQGVCTAALSPATGEFISDVCEAHPRCLLHLARQNERKDQNLPLYHRETVACPLHFWGFRHIIEVPPQQVSENEDEKHATRNERVCITAGPAKRVQVAAGLNAYLGLHEKHWTEISANRNWQNPEYDRNRILDLLRNQDLDLIYFFCHAFGGEADPTIYPPYLQFQAKGGGPGKINPEHFANVKPWPHGPLVILNACGTLGYSPDALSPFLEQLVDGLGASGVLGTEVPVAEILATEFARIFLEQFLLGKQAGEVLLYTRRRLMASYIPLGLAYTLYAPAELAIDIDGDGKCAE